MKFLGIEKIFDSDYIHVYDSKYKTENDFEFKYKVISRDKDIDSLEKVNYSAFKYRACKNMLNFML
jgi:hypothetical protein